MNLLQVFMSFFLSYYVLGYTAYATADSKGSAVASSVSSSVYHQFENLTKKPAAEISHEDGWAIVSLMENGNRIYWFLAPDVKKVSPALFKKTIHLDGVNTKETATVSQCDAPKQTCDNLMKKFEAISLRYK